MTKYANLKIQAMKSYNPPIENRRKFVNGGGCLCDFNEGILDEEVAKEIRDTIGNQDIALYPEYTNGLIRQIAKYCGVDEDQVMLTNGSDQGIDLIFRTFTGKRDKVIIPSPSFAMFYQCAAVAENEVLEPVYEQSSGFPLNRVLDEIDGRTKLVVICNPNNPTGTLVSLANIEKVLKKALEFGAIVYIDEAYYEFSGVTAAGLISKYPNLIITRTFSKAFALAGLRIGYVLGQAELLTEMRKIIGPYDVNMAAVSAAKISLNSLGKIQKIVTEVIKARKMLEDFFKEQNVPFWPSEANFILFKPKDSQKTFEKLEKYGIRARLREGANIEGTLRISVGLPKEMEKIIAILRKQKYAFIDRDGTLIFEPQDTFQVNGLEQLRVLDGVISGLKSLINRGFKLVMITNQDGLGTSDNPQDNFDLIQKILLGKFTDNGIIFEQILVCPHFSSENCDCRKPKTGLVDELFKSGNVDLQNSIMIGDRDSDKKFAENLGIKYVPMKVNGTFPKLFI